MCLDSILVAYVHDTFYQSLDIRYHYVACIGFILGGTDFCVFPGIVACMWSVFFLVVVVANCLPVAVNVLALYFIYGPPGVFAPYQSLPELFHLLIKKFWCGAYCFGPMGKGTNDTVLSRQIVMTIPL